jgi:hypothetical protein
MRQSFVLIFIFLASIATGSIDKEKYVINVPKPKKVSKIEYAIPEAYRDLIIFECAKYNIPLYIFIRHIDRESRFNPKAINYNYKKDKITGERYLVSKDEGIGQFNSRFHSEQVELDNNGNEFNPMNPYEAIPVIAHRLYRVNKLTNNWIITIAEYNCGLTRALNGNFPEVTKRHLAYVFGEKYGENSKNGKA